RTCRICLTAPANTRFIPCFHSIACHDDASNLLRRRGSCPVCREPIESVEEGEFAQTFAPRRQEAATTPGAASAGSGRGASAVAEV
ncbi:unnamed protein product, partial [Hapterophycus canaliculatus]